MRCELQNVFLLVNAVNLVWVITLAALREWVKREVRTAKSELVKREVRCDVAT